MDQRILDLHHTTRSISNDGIVLVLNTGSVIGPEATAMLQALHSRSLEGVREHLKIVAEKGPEKFLDTFYVGYGHQSIGDCGTGTLFIEGVSMLVAKAVQDWLLYSGQEGSTRYMDFSTQQFIDPVGSPMSRNVLEAWRSFYLGNQEGVRKHLRAQFPRQAREDPKVYEKAIRARAFDILRGFLPAGAATKFSWHSNLRQMADHLKLLRHHPLAEVQAVASSMEDALKEAYPSSFNHKRHPDTGEYNRFWMQTGYYFSGSPERHNRPFAGTNRALAVTRDSVDRLLLWSDYREFLKRRPLKTELPKQIAEAGTVQFEFLIDFGSFRDIQRHRAVIQRMPLVMPDFGFHPWYLESLPLRLSTAACELVERQLNRIEKLNTDRAVRQYYLPMGMCVPCRLTGDLAALTYLVERRARADVHPTLQEVALAIADELLKRFGDVGLQLYTEREMGRFDIRRGLQDIVRKE